MSDTNLDPSISALSTRATEVAASASPKELLNLSRIAPSLEQSENAGLEVAINSRAAGLAPSATATELKSIGKAIGNVLEPDTFTAGAFIPAQLDQSGKFLGTSGTSKNWSGVTVSGLSEVNISAIANDETLVYNNVSSQFENSSQVFNIPQYAQTADLPASATSGATAFDASTAELKYWDGSEWKVAAVVAAAGGGSTTTVDWSGLGTDLASADFTINGDGMNYPTSGELGAGLALNGNTLILSQQYGPFKAYDTDTGNLLWTANTDGTNVWGSYKSQMDAGDTYWGALESDQEVVVRSIADGSFVVKFNRMNPASGVDYSGPFSNDNWGMSDWGKGISVHGDKIAIGDAHSERRRVHLFELPSGNHLYTIEDPNTTHTNSLGYNTKFGANVFMDDTYIAINSPSDRVGGVEDSGIVHVFNVSDGSFIRSFTEPTPKDGVRFGGHLSERSFDISNGKIAIGASDERIGNAYVFDIASGNLEATLTDPNMTSTSMGDGYSIRIEGNDVAYLSSYQYSEQYTIRMFDWTDGSMTRKISTGDRWSRFEMDGNTIVVTAPSSVMPGGGEVRWWNGVESTSGGGSGSSGTVGSVDWSAGTLSSTVFADGHAAYKNLGKSVSIDDTYYAIGSQKGVVSMFLVSDDSERRTFTSTVNNQGGKISLNGNGKLAVSNGNSSGQIWIHDIEGNTVDTIDTGAIPFDSYANRVERGFDFKGKWFAFRDGAVNKWQSHPISGGYAEQGRLYIYDIENGPSGGTSPLYEIDESTIISALETDGTTAIVDGLSGSNVGTLEIDATNEILWISFPGAATTLNGSGMTSGDGWHDRNAGVVVPIDLTTGNIIISKTIPNAQIREGVASTQSQLPNAGDVPMWYDRLYPQDRRQPRNMKWGQTLAVSSTHIAIGASGAYTNEWYSLQTGGAIFVYNISGDTPLLEAIIYQSADSSDFDYYRNNATGTGGNTLVLPTKAQSGYFPSSLALNDTQLFIGSTHSGPDGLTASNVSSNEGAVFVVNLSDYTLAHNIDNPNFTGETNQSYFGSDVAVYGNKLVVGEVYRGQQQNGGGQLITLS